MSASSGQGLLAGVRPDALYRFTTPLLYAGLVFCLVLIPLLAWASSFFLYVYAALVLAVLVGAILASDELVLLCVVLVGFIAQAQYEEGFQIEEILYGLMYVSYLSFWYISRAFFYRDRFVRTAVDGALMLFLIYVTLSLPLTPILGGEIPMAVSEWLSVSMLAFYFPIKEASMRLRGRRPERAILLSLGVLALYIAFRNFLYYRRGLAEADFLFEIATGRVVMNEHVLLLGGIASLAFLIHARRKLHWLALVGLFTTLSAGVIIGQSRALWVSYALGVFVIFLFVDRKKKVQLLVLAAAGLTTVLAIGSIVFDNFFTVIVAGFLDRLFSLRTAAVKDLSLINRFVEMGAALDYIRLNPVVGHGFGVSMKYYSLVYEWTHETSFIHNGPIGVIYRHGLVGAGLLAVFYFGTMIHAFQTMRNEHTAAFDRTLCLAVLACLTAESLVGNTENPFATSDKTLMIGALAGLVGAARWRTRQRAERSADVG